MTNNSFLIFLSVFTIIMGLLGSHIYFRFIRKLSIPLIAINILKIIFLFSVLSMLAFPFFRLHDLSDSLLFVVYLGVGSFFLLIFISLFYDFFQSILNLSHKTHIVNTGRRNALKTFIDITFVIMGVLYFLKAFGSTLKKAQIKTTHIPLGLDSFKIIQISDLHIGSVIKKDFIDEMVERINKTNPDLILLTGDIVDAPLYKIKDDIPSLNNLRAKYGVFMCLGNHEYYQGGVLQWTEYFKQTSIKLLINENVIINDKLNLVSLADKSGYRFGHHQPNLQQAFKNTNKNIPTIVMSHQPIMIDEIAPFSPELVLSGHTHGGQIFPFGILVKIVQKYLSGLYQHNKKTKIFVSKGAGYWGPPIRVLADNEVNLLVL